MNRDEPLRVSYRRFGRRWWLADALGRRWVRVARAYEMPVDGWHPRAANWIGCPCKGAAPRGVRLVPDKDESSDGEGI